MRLSELGEKEIVNLDNGARLGLFYDADLIINQENGKIINLLVTERKTMFKFLGTDINNIEIPWTSIRKIGYDMIIVEFDY